MIFRKIPIGLSDEEVEDLVVERFRDLRRKIFNILPTSCFLKPVKCLTGEMVAFISKEILDQGLIEREDVCSLCSETACLYNNVKDKEERIIKLRYVALKDPDLKIAS